MGRGDAGLQVCICPKTVPEPTTRLCMHEARSQRQPLKRTESLEFRSRPFGVVFLQICLGTVLACVSLHLHPKRTFRGLQVQPINALAVSWRSWPLLESIFIHRLTIEITSHHKRACTHSSGSTSQPRQIGTQAISTAQDLPNAACTLHHQRSALPTL